MIGWHQTLHLKSLFHILFYQIEKNYKLGKKPKTLRYFWLRQFEHFNSVVYPPASRARRYKFHPAHSLPPICKKIKISLMDEGQLKNAWLSVICLFIHPSICPSVRSSIHWSSPILYWSFGLIWITISFTKTRENEYVKILTLEFRSQPPRVKPLG